MSLRALLYAYVLGGITFIPLIIFACVCITIYTSVPVSNDDATKNAKSRSPQCNEHDCPKDPSQTTTESPSEINDLPRTRKAWLTVRRTFEESFSDGSYVTFVKSYLDARSKDPKRSRPKDVWYVVLKGKVMYLYEDEEMTECEAAIELGRHDVVIYPEGLLDGELFTRRNAICLKPRAKGAGKGISGSSKDGVQGDGENDEQTEDEPTTKRSRECNEDAGREESWFIFVRSCVDMEDWYLALVHASDHPSGTPTLLPLNPVFLPSEMNHLVTTLDEQPDVIPMRWLNALLGRVFYSFYRTQVIESYIIGRLMKKLSKVKRPAFLTDIAVTQFSVGNKAPTFSKPMLKELTKEGDASLEVGLSYKGEIRATVEATAVINLGARFKSYTVKLVLAVVLRELEGNLLVKVKRPPSSRIWYAFTKPPRMVVNVEPIVSDRQITWSMILNTIESKIEEIIIDSVVMPNMDDISFFDSVDYEHRGGIWADTVRLEKPMTTPISEQGVKPTVNDVGAQSSDEAGPSTLARAHPEEEAMTETPSLDAIPIIRSVTTSSDRPSKTARRRSWFSSGTEDELHDEHAREEEEEEVSRGRRERSAQAEGRRLSPLPNADTPTVHPSDFSDHDFDPQAYLSPQFPPRSSSAHSSHSQPRSRAHSISSSVGGEESTNYLSDSSAASKSPHYSLGTSTSSFLSTLKSKAGDKQALSNTAKEAMRKWGVNWGLKKDNGGNTTDDLPDVGAPDHQSRTESTHGRQSYADVRAAVAERREREQVDNVPGSSTSPIPIPSANGGTKGRSPSMSGTQVTSYSGGFPISPGTPSKMAAQEAACNPSKSASTSLSRSLGDTSNDPFKDRDLTDVTKEHPAPSLIHTQPSQARTMTIPGIHASHRGEVMSMGNVAPVFPASESKPKGPTIQSVYRLWKSPILTGQPQPELPLSSSTSGRGDVNDRNQDVAPLSLTQEAILPPARAVPPPLPPRTIPTVAVRHTTEEDSTVASTISPASEVLKSVVSRDETTRAPVDQGVTAATVGDETILPAALRALEGTLSVNPAASSDNKPPLPPRRIHVPAS